MVYKILIVEDSSSIRDELVVLLENNLYEVVAVTDFANILKKVEEVSPDLILLDIILPNINGIDICREIRQKNDTPIIFVTSKATTESELNAILIGGDDYITKPYNAAVLLARITSVLKRYGKGKNNTSYICKGCKLNLLDSTISYNGQSTELTKNELRICYNLFSKCGQIDPREYIIEDLWDNEMFIDDNTLSVNITRIRGKLKDIGVEDLIKTKRGIGYKI
ncbi:MAG TPA: response regulator transcription factor [Gallicola sp.]|nr:response regulator transcription factor [Gallicola sp.]